MRAVQIRTLASETRNKSSILVYEFFAQFRTPESTFIIVINVLVYVFFARLRTSPSTTCRHTIVLVYACCTAPNHINEKTRVTYGFGICVFFCTAPNLIIQFHNKKDCFGICIFVQLRTRILHIAIAQMVLVYACCSALNPFYLMFPQGEKFWHMCFCTAPNQIKYDLHLLVCFGICVFFVQLRTHNWDTSHVTNVLVYVFFAQLRTCCQSVAIILWFWYMCFFAQLRTVKIRSCTDSL